MVQRVGGVVACPGGVGSVSGAGWFAGVALVHACPQGARQCVGRQDSGDCGQEGGAWCLGLA